MRDDFSTRMAELRKGHRQREQFHDESWLEKIILCVRQHECSKYPALVAAARAIVDGVEK